jgi:hypothetical protein
MRSLLVGALLLGSGFAAQAQSETIVLSPTDRTSVREYIVRERPASIAMPTGVQLTIGATLPETVTLRTFPSSVGVRHRYVVVDGRTVLVEPQSRRIVQIIE